MDVEFLARLQFAFTIMFHYLYAPLTIGLALILVIIEGTYITTKKAVYLQLARFWTHILALTFVFGAATGIVMEFEFGTNWASYSRYVGEVFGSPLAAEGIFSFFLESMFLGILVFGWHRVSVKMHFFSTIMVCVGAHLSAVWIIVANSWMHTPAGFRLVGEGLKRRAEITDFWAMVFNPSMVDRLIHVILGAWLSGAFFVIGICAYYLLRKKFEEGAVFSMKVASIVAAISLLLQGLSGDASARGVAAYSPVKLAAYEGIFATQRGAPLSIFGIVNQEEQRIDYQIAIPYMLSLLAYRTPSAEIQGLNTVPPQDQPNISVIFQTYHLMVATWALMILVLAIAWWYWRRGTIRDTRWVLHMLILSALLPQIGNQAGWVSTEMGRYPWIVANVLRICDGLSASVHADQLAASLFLFFCLYLVLFVLYLFLLGRTIQKGPVATSQGVIS